MMKSLAAVSLLVPDYDEGPAFLESALGFAVEEDIPLGAGKRWVGLAPPEVGGARIAPALPGDERRRGRFGDQTGGRVGHFLLTDDFEKAYAATRARGATFLEAPREERYRTVAVFVDPWGGKWDLLQPAGRADRKAGAPG